MPVSFRCLKRVSVCWVMGRILFSGKLWGAADVLVLLRQFWITERTCGQLVAATGQHRLELLEPHQSFPVGQLATGFDS